LQEDNRHKEGIYFKTKNSSIELGKVLKKGGNRILVEHWTSAKAQNLMTRTVIFPSSEKLFEAEHLLISPEMFERSGIKSKEAGGMEIILQELETVEELEVEIVKNRTKNLDVASDLIDKESNPNMAQMGFSWVLVDLERNIALDEFYGKTIETLSHITKCTAFELRWKRIEALTGENAWNTLTPEAKSKINPLAFSRIIFGSDVSSRAVIRLNIAKGLISQKVVDKLNEFFPSYRDTKVAIMAVLQEITKQSKQSESCSSSNGEAALWVQRNINKGVGEGSSKHKKQKKILSAIVRQKEDKRNISLLDINYATL
ncbi:34153_t:CDS:2, partial [Gigaspora margarita]